MRTRVAGLSVILSCGLLFTGCAKKELIQKEETPPPATAPSGQAPGRDRQAQQAEEQKQQVAEKRMQETPVKEEGDKGAAVKPAEAVLETVYFDFDSYVLSPAGREALSKNAEQLKKNPNIRVVIEGHCDERGSDEYNLALGEKRAKAAKDYLVSLGIPADRLSVLSYGKEKPADQGHDEAAWARNRRAVLLVQK